MATHRKTPTFIRITHKNNLVVCINPTLMSSFQIIEGASIKVKGKEEPVIANTVRFFFPAGTGLSYSVGIDITQEEFDYICSTLAEFLYLNEVEFEAKSKAIATSRMDEWKALSKQNEEEAIVETTKEA